MPNLAAIKRESSSSAVRPSQPIEPLRRTVRIQPARGPKVARDCETRRAFCPAQRCRQQVDGSHQPCVRGQQDPPHLQRHIPAMSPDEHLGLLRRDVDTVLELQLHSYSDEAWTPVAEAFAEYGDRRPQSMVVHRADLLPGNPQRLWSCPKTDRWPATTTSLSLAARCR
jgi:hypothetical protein